DLDPTQLTGLVGSKDVAVLQERSAVNRIETGVLCPAPHDFSVRPVRGELQQDRLTAIAPSEQEFSELPRGPDGHGIYGCQGNGPIGLPGLRIEAVDRFTMPNDELFLAAGLDQGWWTVTGFPGRQRAPEFLAVLLVESDRNGSFAANHANQFAAVHERMT